MPDPTTIPALPTMSNQHRTTPAQWAALHPFFSPSINDTASCILELRDRVEALEAAALGRDGEAAERAAAPTSTNSLVDRVINAIDYEHGISPSWKKEARAAIREVAAWLREQDPEPGPIGRLLGQVSTPCNVIADELERESNR